MPAPQATPRGTTAAVSPSSSGVPAPLRAAFELMIAHDSRPDLQDLRTKSISLLKLTRDLLAAPDGAFAREVLEHYLGVYIPSKSTSRVITQMRLKEVPPLPTGIIEGFRQETSHRQCLEPVRYYRSAFGTMPNDVLGVRAFQRDYLSFLDEVIVTVERTELVPHSCITTIDKISAFVMGFCSKSRASHESPKHASSVDLAYLLRHLQPVNLLSLQVAASNLTIRDNIKSLAVAVDPLLRRAREVGVVISPEMERELTAWAAQNELVLFSRLPRGQRDALVNSLRLATTQLLAGERAECLELEWMAKVQDAQRNYEYRFDRADIDPANPENIPEYPEVNYRFARALRLTMPELNDLKRASEFLEREGFCGMRIEMDQSPFLWPRIAEAILIAKPSEIILRSPTLYEPFEAPTAKSVKAFLCQRVMHVIPVTLTTSPKEIIEQEVYLASKRPVDWTSSSSGETCLGDQQLNITIEPDLQVTEEVRGRLPHMKPHSNCFTIRDPKEPSSAPPVAIGVLFSNRSPEIHGYATHAFGKTICIFRVERADAVCSIQARQDAPHQASEIGGSSMLSFPTSAINPQTSPIVAPMEAPKSLPSANPVTQPAGNIEGVTKPVIKPPPPPPVKEPRPKISDEQARVAKEVLAAIPEIQGAARSSRALKPEVPFSDPELTTSLHILKNGEKPGNKKLKALRDYVSRDANFRDALTSTRLRGARQDLGTLLDALLT